MDLLNNDFDINSLLQNTGVSTAQDSIGEILDRFGLNWNVKKEPLFLEGGTPTEFFGVVREDIKHCFNTVKDGYQPFQNSELLELVNRAAQTMGLKLDKGGSFKKGALVYLQLQTGLLKNIGENRDSIQKYITALNSHDGSCSLKWGMSNITISCQNTFWASARDLQNTVKHTISMHDRIDEICRQIEGVQAEEKKLYDIFFKLAEVPVRKPHISEMTKILLGIDVDAKREDLSTYQLNRLRDFSGSVMQEMKQKGPTLWGLFSGVTQYTTHKMPGSDEGRKQSKAIGQGFDKDNKAFQYVAELVN